MRFKDSFSESLRRFGLVFDFFAMTLLPSIIWFLCVSFYQICLETKNPITFAAVFFRARNEKIELFIKPIDRFAFAGTFY